MITDTFGSLIEELGNLLKMKLTPGPKNSCAFRLRDQMMVYIEPDKLGERLTILIDITPVPPGKYGENIMREALKANGLPPPRGGIFAYGAKKDALLLFDQTPMDELNAPRLLELTNSLIQKARVWKTAIDRGETPSYQSMESTYGTKSSSGRGKGLFGL